MRKTFTLLFVLLSVSQISAQVTTQGTDFWVGLLYNIRPISGTKEQISIAAKRACSGTITNPNSGYSVSFTLAANSVTSIIIPPTEIRSDNAEVMDHRAVHVEATDTVSVYTVNNYFTAIDASYCLPTPALGSAHYIISYPSATKEYPNEALIVGVEDNTEVQITPTQNTTGSMLAGVTYTITVNRGETYMFSSLFDLTGTLIKTIDPCDKIVVLGGSACAWVPFDVCPSDCDHIYEQMLPLETWGQSFFCAPLHRQLNDVFRVVASTNNTRVTIGSNIRTLDAGQFFDTMIYRRPLAISANRPIGVTGYVISSPCNNGWGAPDMYWVPPMEQNLHSLVFTSTPLLDVDSHYVNIIVKTADTGVVKLNGGNMSATFTVDPDYPQYAYSQYALTNPVNNLESDKGFMAIAYGGSNASGGSGSNNNGSYAYAAGTGVEKLPQKWYRVNDIVNDLTDTQALCLHKPYTFSLLRPGRVAWDFGDGDTVEQLAPIYQFADTGYHTIHAYPISCAGIITDTLAFVIYIDELCVEPDPGDTLLCPGKFVQLRAKSTIPQQEPCYTHEWYIGNNRIGRGTVTVSPINTTIYRVISTDTCFGIKDTNFVKVIIPSPVNARLNNDTTICKGNAVLLSVRGSLGDSSYTFTWIKGLAGDGYSDTTVTPPVTTIYAVIVDDECTSPPDTAYTTVFVRPELAIQMRDTTVCTGDSVVLKPIGAGGDSSYTYQWRHSGTFADSLVFSTDTATTTLEIWLTDACTVKPDTGFVTVYIRPNPEITISPDTTICIGGVAFLQAWGLFGDSSYIITWKDIGTGSNALVSPAITTTYQVMVNDECSALGDTARIRVNVRPPLKAQVCPDTIICTGQSVDLWAKGNGGDSSYTYTWDNGLGSADIVNVTPTATTTYRVIAGDDCTTKNDTAYTTVYVRPPLGLIVNNDTTICIGQSVNLAAIGSGGDSTYTYTWDQGLGTGASHTVTPNITTTYTVTLNDNCSPAIQEQITVIVEGNPVIDFNAVPTEICQGDSITFTNLTTGNYTYLWRFGDQTISTDESPVHFYHAPGLYNITLVAISPLLCRDSMTVPGMVEVYATPVAAYTTNPPATSLLTPLIHFKNSSQSASSYLWDFGDMNGSTDKDPKHIYLDTGWYKVTLIVTGANNCSDTAWGRLRINDYYRIFIPSAFSPNGDNTNELFEVKGRGVAEYHMTIYNRWGEIVFESNSMTHSWDGAVPGHTRPSPDGLYYYMVDLMDVNLQRHLYNGRVVLLK